MQNTTKVIHGLCEWEFMQTEVQAEPPRILLCKVIFYIKQCEMSCWLRRRKILLLQLVVGQLKLIRAYLVEILLMKKSMLLGYANATSACWDPVVY